MAGSIFANINPSSTSGTQLASILNSFKDLVASGASGTSRPTNLVAGGYWVDTSNAGSPGFYWEVKIYTGSSDVVVYRVNLTTNTASIAGAEGSFVVSQISADTVGPLIRFLKERIASSGQTLIGDDLGQIEFAGAGDDNSNPVIVRIKAIASDDTTATESGGYLSFEATSASSNAIAQMMVLRDGKLGIGTDTPGANLDVDGDVAIRSGVDVASSGTLADVSTLNTSYLRFTNASVVNSFANPADGKLLLVTNASAGSITISNNSGGTEANRIFTGTGADFVLAQNASALLTYDLAASRWRLVNGLDLSSVVTLSGSETLTNKTLTSPVINSPTGLVKADVGLGNVDNTSDASKNSATATLTNKTIDADLNTISNIDNADIKSGANIDHNKMAALTVSRALVSDGSGVVSSSSVTATEVGLLSGRTGTLVTTEETQTLTNKTITAPVISTISNTGTLTLPASTDTLVGRATTDTLTNKTLTSPEINSPNITTPTVDVMNLTNQGSTPATPASGLVKVYSKSADKKLYYLNDAGTESLVGAGAGSGSINYVTNTDAETDTSGWATYADAAGTSPVDATGGTANITWTRTTSSPIRGAASFLLTKDAANRQGQGVSFAFTHPGMSEVCDVSFEYNVASGTFATGDVRVYLYDVTNSLVIEPSAVQIQNTGITTKHKSTFQTTLGATSYRLVLHVASTSTSAYSLKVDNVLVGPQNTIQGAFVSDWTSFTPTGSWTTNTTYTGKYRRVGDTAQIQYQLVLTGTPTSANLTLNPPPGLSVDTAKLEVSNTIRVAGTGFTRDVSATGNFALVPSYQTSANGFIVSYLDDSVAGGGVGIPAVTQAAPFTYATGDFVNIEVSAPIAGWSSGVTYASDAGDGRVVAASYGKTESVQTVPANTFTKLAFSILVADETSSFNSTTFGFTVPLAGFYRVSIAGVNTALCSVGQTLYIGVGKNSVASLGTRINSQYVGTANVQYGLSGSCLLKCVAGDIIYPMIFGTTEAFSLESGQGVFSVERISGPSAIAAGESTNAKYRTTAGQQFPAAIATLIDFSSTFVYASHGNSYRAGTGYNSTTGVYTVYPGWPAPMSGKYRITVNVMSASIGGSVSSYTILCPTVDGVVQENGMRQSGESTATANRGLQSTFVVQALAGQYLNAAVLQNLSATYTLNSGSSQYNWITFERVGNY